MNAYMWTQNECIWEQNICLKWTQNECISNFEI